MLRWKTPSAVCAIMLTACPLTSFAQQIVKPAPRETTLLQPMGPIKIPGKVRKAAYAPLVPLVRPQQAIVEYPVLQAATEAPEPRTAALAPLPSTPPIQLRTNPASTAQRPSSTYRQPASVARTPMVTQAPVVNQTPVATQTPTIARSPIKRAASPKIIIRNPFVQPNNPNLYLFVVENVGTVDATNASVDLYVPQDVTITKVVPASASSSAQRAHVNLANLKAGAKSIIEVEVSPTTNVVEFQTRLALESVHVFSTAATPNYMVQSRPRAEASVAQTAPVSTPTVTPITPTITTHIAAELNVPLTPPTEIVSAIPLEPLATPEYSAPANQVSQVSQTQTPLLPLETNVANPNIAAGVPAATTSAVANTFANPVAVAPARTGKAQPPNVANAAIANANGVQAQLASARSVAAQVSADGKLSATVDGPVTLNANQEAHFSITVTNPNQTEATDIIVQLAVPAGLKVTVLDRDAWFDEENQTISWEINQLDSGKKETIQYKAIGNAVGQKNQKVTIGMQNVFQGKAQLVTLVSN